MMNPGDTVDTPHGPAVVVFVGYDEETGNIEILMELI